MWKLKYSKPGLIAGKNIYQVRISFSSGDTPARASLV